MISLLIIFSFLIHFISLIAIFYLYKQLQLNKKIDQADVLEQMTSLLKDIQIENERLQNDILNKTTTDKSNHSHLQSSQTISSKVNKRKNEKVTEIETRQHEMDSIKDHIATSFQAKVLQFYNQGLSESEVAKKLNIGHREVSLIIKLYNHSKKDMQR